ncbi:MAG: hypothetical protein HC836_36945 [Richelia sp. RM2_1_2]|nr:hypothetical protein [Richelia sp. RM2_1_2]
MKVFNKETTRTHRRLKAAYEDTFGKPISDRTWRRRLSEIKQFSDGFSVFRKDASQIVRQYAEIKRRYSNVLGKGKEHSKRMEAFNYFYSMDKSLELTGEQFINMLSKFMRVDSNMIPPSNFYYWFSKSDLQFNLKQYYKVRELSIVAYVASLWAINKHNQTVKNADPEANKLVK